MKFSANNFNFVQKCRWPILIHHMHTNKYNGEDNVGGVKNKKKVSVVYLYIVYFLAKRLVKKALS